MQYKWKKQGRKTSKYFMLHITVLPTVEASPKKYFDSVVL